MTAWAIVGLTVGWSPLLAPPPVPSGRTTCITAQVADDDGKGVTRIVTSAAATTAAMGLAAAVSVNGIFGVLDNTADELADIFGVTLAGFRKSVGILQISNHAV